MRLVLDTNILISALIRDSITREILVHPEMEYLVPEFALEEIEDHKEELLQKSSLSKNDFDLLFEYLKDNIVVISDKEISHKELAKQIMKNIDIKDSIFIALALSTKNDGIWSQDNDFDKQSMIKVWRTKDLMDYLEITHR